MVMARELSPIVGIQMRAFWSLYRIAIYCRTTSITELQPRCGKQTSKTLPIAAFDAGTLTSLLRLILRLQVSANQVPAAIDFRRTF
jgi:hypothetical protein